MARANVKTLLPLDRFAQIVGIHPLHFNQVEVAWVAEAKVCESPLVQHAWQDADRIGREELAQAIADAEEMIAKQTRFKVLPTWEIYEEQVYPRPAIPEVFNAYNSDLRGFPLSIKTNWRYVITGGRKGLTLIRDEADVNFGDADGDGYSEIASIVVATTVTDPEEIVIFYPHKDGDDLYEIRPITVVINGGVATITCRREQLVRLELMEALEVNAVDGLDNTKFLDTVDVYRRYNDTSVQAILLWHNFNNPCGCGLSSCTVCQLSSQDGCITVQSTEIGRVFVYPWTYGQAGQETLALSRQPDKARLYYRAGWTKDAFLTKMDPIWERVVAYLASSLLDRPLCACSSSVAFNEYWRADLSLAHSNSTGSFSHRLSSRLLDNPFGTTRGAIFAWNYVKRYLADG